MARLWFVLPACSLALALASACGSSGGGAGGGVGGGAGGGTGGGGTGGASGEAEWLKLCNSSCDSASGPCPDVAADAVEDCHRSCKEQFSHPRAPGCQAQLLAYYQCLSKPNNIKCDELTFTHVDQCVQVAAPLYECLSGEAICNVASPAPSGGSCYAGRGECNLMLDDCPSDQVCGAATGGETKCFPLDGPATSSVCSPCEVLGSDCKGGAVCFSEPLKTQTRCTRFCCTDADCDGIPGSCWEVDTEFHIKICYR